MQWATLTSIAFEEEEGGDEEYKEEEKEKETDQLQAERQHMLKLERYRED